MKLYLKNGHVFLPKDNKVILNKNIVFEVSVLDNIEISNYTFIANVNGSSITFINELAIPQSLIDNTSSLRLSITAINKDTNEVIKYTGDSVPLTRAIVLGINPEEYYSNTVSKMMDDILELQLAVKEIVNKGDIL